MSSINSIGSAGISMTPAMRRPDPSKMTDNLFAKLDTTNKGYLDKSDLQSAAKTSSTGSIDETFTKLDVNSDGQLTKSEVSDGIKKFADALSSQLNQTRMSEGQAKGPHQGMPPPPATDTNTTTNTSSDPADSNRDGTVSAQEAVAYANTSANTATVESAAAYNSTASTNNDSRALKQMMDIMSMYGYGDDKSNRLSVSA
ncbi:MAG: EF-hand domain-containing protein [Gallionella sp.]|jgi:hypothetical protein